MRGIAAIGSAGAVWLALSGCASDRILPAEARCGDGIVTAPEECDADSPGCDACRVVDGYSCEGDTCTEVCGDGQVVGEEECDPPDGVTCDQSCREASRDGCSMQGYYVVRQNNYSRDTIVGQVQTSSLWYLFEFTQSGDDFQVKNALACGLRVSGSVDVSLDTASERAILYSTHQGSDFAQGPRRGKSSRDGDQCRFSLERWYLIRGTDQSYLPDDFRALPALPSLKALPKEEDPLNPSADGPPGSLDTDGDGIPGFALRISGNLPGIRSVVQRDWNFYESDADSVAIPDAVEFRVRTDFDNEENVLSVGECDPAACGLLVAGSSPARDLPGRVTFRYLGQDLSDPRVSSVVLGSPGSDEELDLQTCANVQKALPHDPSHP